MQEWQDDDGLLGRLTEELRAVLTRAPTSISNAPPTKHTRPPLQDQLISIRANTFNQSLRYV